MTFVDTHCHLYDEAFDTDRDNAVQRALDAGVTTMLLPDIDSSSSPALDALYNTHPQHFRRMAGLHPTSVKEDYEDELQHVHDRLYSSPKLGEGDRRGAVVEEYVRIMFSPCAEGERASGDDEVYLYAYCPEMEQGVLSAPAYRRMGSVQLTLPERWQGKEVHLYGFAVDYEGNASATVYIGMLDTIKDSEARYYGHDKNDIPCWRMLLGHTALLETNQRRPRDTDGLRQWQLGQSPTVG